MQYLRKNEVSMTIPGPSGDIETIVAEPTSVASVPTWVLVCHPDPQQEGTMHNKVVTTLARSANDCGWTACRFNYRGVGGSAGAYGEAIGEREDALAVIKALCPPDHRLLLAGFSFGAYIASQCAQVLDAGGLLVGPPVERFTFPTLPPHRWAVIQGDDDDVVATDAVVAWAQQQALPLTRIEAAGHFFHGKLGQLATAAKKCWGCHE